MTDVNEGATVQVDMRVRVFPDSDEECGGVVVDDFGDSAGQAVDIGENHIADPARRWAVRLDDGSLVFTDGSQLKPE